MKAKNHSNGVEGCPPRHCYFWIAHLTDGTVIPEYDFDNQRHNRPRSLPLDFVTKFSWYPVNLTMLVRVKQVFDEDLKLAIDTKIHTVDIDLESGEQFNNHPVWRNQIRFVGRQGTFTKYALFKTKKNGDIEGYFIDETGIKIDEEI
jgi:hypothetical protein